jgi:trehalose synthase
VTITHVPISPLPPERFRDLLGEGYDEVEAAVDRAAELLGGRAVWHLNSTARGGGVAELLQSLLAYARGAGVDARWSVIDGDADFFAITKRIHNHLHGWPGDGRVLGQAEQAHYEATLEANARELARTVRAGDIVFCHDPQTAGLVSPLIRIGATVVWRCHVGIDLPNGLARGAWHFLRPYVEPADAYVFSRREFVWAGLDPGRVWIVPPSIDAFSPKNQDLAPEAVTAILGVIGLSPPDDAVPAYRRVDGSPGRVDRLATIDQDALLPSDASAVVQVSRWDTLKDPIGVLRGFVEHCPESAHLVLAGPAVEAVSDDPEGAAVLADVRQHWSALPAPTRERVHLVCLPMDDISENAAMVNAIQRRAQVIVQKSLAEGFGLTVAEAMWKSRPVIASRRGALQDMISDGETGILLDDPQDLATFGNACTELLGDPDRAATIGAAARRRVTEQFLGTRHLVQYLRLLEGMPALGAGR